jgi:hypothetical protein
MVGQGVCGTTEQCQQWQPASNSKSRGCEQPAGTHADDLAGLEHFHVQKILHNKVVIQCRL